MKKSIIIALAAITLYSCGSGTNQNQNNGATNADTTVTQNVATQNTDTTATVETPQCDVSTPVDESPVDESPVDESPADDPTQKPYIDRVKQYAAKLPTAYADTVYYFYKSVMPDGDNRTDEDYYLLPYKSGGFFVIVRICSMESGNVYNYDYHYNYINGEFTKAKDVYPTPKYTDFVSDGNAADAERIAQLTDDFVSSFSEGVLRVDALPSGLEEEEELQEIEKYQHVTYKWNGEKFVKFNE
ncbi:MAG: hypothetical protein IKR94_00140 [Bacteroidales bacterium]|nr:hypothetical protein [Bacteroidales bacterium]